jgi:transposase InsO family protein
MQVIPRRLPRAGRWPKGGRGARWRGNDCPKSNQSRQHIVSNPYRDGETLYHTEAANRITAAHEVTPCSWQLAALNRELRAWEQVYNTVRPSQALDYSSPQEFLARWPSQPKESKCH